MLQRGNFYELRNNLLEKLIDLGDIPYDSDKAIDFLNSSDLSDDISDKLEKLIKAEDLIKAILNMIIIKITPYVNDLIEYDNKKSNKFTNLKLRIENFFKDLDKKREILIDKIALQKDLETNYLAHKFKIQAHQSYLERVLKEFVLRVLISAYKQYKDVKSPALVDIQTDEENPNKKVKTIHPLNYKDEKAFWYCVYFFFLEVAQANLPVIAGEIQAKPMEFSEYNKMTQGGFYPESSPPEVSSQHSTTPDPNPSGNKNEKPQKQLGNSQGKDDYEDDDGESEKDDEDDSDDSDGEGDY